MNDNESNERSDFIAAPIDNLIAVFHDVEALYASIDELKRAGIPEGAMRAFVGEEGIRAMDFDGTENGPAAELLRYLQKIGPDRTYLDRYESYMRDGDCLLMVHAPEDGRRQRAAEILKKNSAHRVTYFGPFLFEEV